MSVLTVITEATESALNRGSRLIDKHRRSKTLEHRKAALYVFIETEVTPVFDELGDVIENDLKPLMVDVKQFIAEETRPVFEQVAIVLRDDNAVDKGGTDPLSQPPKRWSMFDGVQLNAELGGSAGRTVGAGSSESQLEGLTQELKSRFAAFDDRYQLFVQKHIDPLLGLSRRAELQKMLASGTLAMTESERHANRRLGLGVAAAGLAGLGTFVFAPLMPLAIVAGVTASSAKYPAAYNYWKEKKRLGAIHLICIYSLYLWFGGYAAVGALGALLFGMMLKAKAAGECQSRDNLIKMFQLQPKMVWMRVDGVEIQTPFEQVRIGDILVMRAGQVVPVDGTIVSGAATVDQHMLTGEAQPAEKRAGDRVLAATMLVSGQVDVAVEKTSAETTAGKIAEVLDRTMKEAKPAALSAVESADNLAIPVLSVSLLSFPFIGPAGAVSLLGANTTTASYLSSSLAMLNFMNLAAGRGVLVKDAAALERMSAIDTVFFDKTGTLTIEQPQVVQVHTRGDADPMEVLRLAAAAEKHQTHPVALAILEAANKLGLPLPSSDDAHYEVGYGIKVVINEPSDNGESAFRLIRVGSERFMTMEGIALPEWMHEQATACYDLGHSVVMVAAGEEVTGFIELKPTVRPEAEALIQGLRKRGLAVYLVSGDQEAPTRKLAHDLGMTGYFANQLPEAKAELAAKMQSSGRRVCFIGDGINDAIAMRRAHVSISLLGATTIATDTAQIVLMEGSLGQLLNLFQLADEFARNLKLNFRFTSGVSIAAAAGILLGGFTFVAAEVAYSISIFGAMAITMKPLLEHAKQERGNAESQKQ